jgi:hypothetical protein
MSGIHCLKGREVNRYTISKFDNHTYVVMDIIQEREICVCSEYDEFYDARKRAIKIAKILNISDKVVSCPRYTSH